MGTGEDRGFRIAGPEGIEELVDRMARHVLAAYPEGPAIVGIRRRGVPLAERLADRMAASTGTEFPVQEIALKRYADDLSVLHHRPELRERPELDVEGRIVVAVDDVLYSGRTQFRALELLLEAGAAEIHPLVLCSRGSNEVPIHADFVGLQLDVGEANVIEVHHPPYEERPEILIFRQEDLAEE